MSELRVAYLIETLGAGGTERSLAESLPYLRDAGLEMRVFVLARHEEGFDPLVRASGVGVEQLPNGTWPRRLRELRRRLRDWSPHILHTSLYRADLAGRLAAIGTGTAVLTSLVSCPYEPERLADPRIRRSRLSAARWLDGWTGRHLTRHFHAVSEATKQAAVRRLGLDSERITVIHRGRDVTRFPAPDAERRQAARGRWRIAESETLIVNLGRHAFQKGQILLLEAARRLIAAGRQVQIVIAGAPGPSTEELEVFVANHDLADRVRLVGHVEDVGDLLLAGDVFAFPTRWEGFPGAVLEAIASGLPVVGSAIPPMVEMFENGGGALLVEPESPSALESALGRLLDNPALRQRMGQAGRELFLQRYDLAKLAPRTVELYREVAGR